MDLRKELAERLDADETFVLATIVRTSGSAPRDVGAKMLVFPDGSISGSIGAAASRRW
ncbi:MAG: XdhC family protein [Candidatus Eisenbacteria bacterium]